MGENFLKLLALADRKSPETISKECSIGGVGTTEIDVPILDHGVEKIVTVGVNISIESIDSVEYLYSKSITLTPRYIVVNKSDERISIRQKGE
jgi:vacuolar protein sorting-associated protein 13A/C